jgi:Flp pilus assembly protein TadD
LQQTGREHEIPALWKEILDKNPKNAAAHAKYAIALVQTGNEEEGEKAFEYAVSTLEDSSLVKRYYAPFLAQKGDLDRAMDFYEDCLDLAPTDIPLLLEYAQTLKKADREFEVPKVLRDILACNPDPNTRAQVLAWLIEIEQPRRTEIVEKAREQVENEEYEAALTQLKPLRNWLADYWKMWLLLSVANNKVGNHDEAEEAVKRLLELYPACEPAYSELNTSLWKLGRPDEAYNFLRYAASNMPQSLAVHINLALAAKRAGKDDEAVGLARQIREAVGNNEEVEKVLAEIGA